MTDKISNPATGATMTLSEAIAISYTGVLPPHADEAQRALFDRLKPQGWEPFHNGGGCWALALRINPSDDLSGGCIVLMTDGEMDFPRAHQWMVGVLIGGDDLGYGWSQGTEYDREDDPINTLDGALELVEALKASTMPADLFREIHDRPTAEAWIRALHAAGMMFHFEDDPATIIWHRGPAGGPWSPSAEEIAVLKLQVSKLYEQDWGDLDCPIGFALTLDGVSADATGEVEIATYDRLPAEERVVVAESAEIARAVSDAVEAGVLHGVGRLVLGEGTVVVDLKDEAPAPGWTPEAVAIVDALKAVDSGLWTWVEIQLDGGSTPDAIVAELRQAIDTVEAERAKGVE